MRTMLPRMFLLLAVVVSSALAQNSDLGLLLGVSDTVTGQSTPTVTIGTVSVSGQINYAVQLHDSPGGRLYLELPVVITSTQIGTVSAGGSAGIDETIVFFTPGVRWKFTPAARVSFYGVGGVGIVGISANVGVSGNASPTAFDSTGVTGAADLGGGVDFRLTRLVSLRADIREMPTFENVRGSHHHEFFMLGVGLHF
jgi:opacity protein-like surface antigen